VRKYPDASWTDVKMQVRRPGARVGEYVGVRACLRVAAKTGNCDDAPERDAIYRDSVKHCARSPEMAEKPTAP